MQMENEKNCGILQTHNPPTQQAQSIALLQLSNLQLSVANFRIFKFPIVNRKSKIVNPFRRSRIADRYNAPRSVSRVRSGFRDDSTRQSSIVNPFASCQQNRQS